MPMNPVYHRLETQLAESLRAWRRSHWQRGLSLMLAGFLVLAAFVYMIEPRWPVLWWSVLLFGGAAWLFAIGKYLLLPLLRQPTLQQVARYFEEHHPELEDRLATAFEVGQKDASLIDQKMLERLFRDAAQHAQPIDFSDQLRLQRAQLWRVLLYASAALILIGVFGFSGLFRTRLASYFTDRPQALTPVQSLQVQPGNAHIARGTTVEVIAESPETEVVEATIYLAKAGGEWQAAGMSLTTQPGKFTHNIFEVRDTTRYYVRLGSALSEVFALVPLDAPDVKQLRVTYHYPKKIGLPARREEISGDIYAPIGTAIDLEAIATQALTKAEWRLGEDDYQPMSLLADTLARASFKVEKDSFYVLRLTNSDGLSNTPVEYYIHATPDEAPQVTLVQPGRDLRPTMLEEVPITVAVFEDYGLQALTLVSAQNNGAETRHDLLPALTQSRAPNATRTEYRSEKLLYLEELAVRPGDFISYYIEAQDAQQTVTTDLYFLEVRPFEEEFYRALSSEGGGGENAGGLSLTQKEIVTATWKLDQSRGKISPEELQTSSAALAETQEALRESIMNMAENARLRGNIAGESGAGNLVQLLEQSAQSMSEAVPLLEQAQPAEALTPERRAYHFLLQADAEIRRREITQGNSGSSSFAQLQSQEDLARLFKEELDKLQSKYETLQNTQQQQREAQLNQAQEKVRELAQRQERLVDLNRQIAREQQPPEERRRQLQRLQREQEQIQRELQNLSRQMSRNQASANNSASQQLTENLQEAAQDLQRAQDELRRNNPSQAAAEGNRALERLQDLEEQLQQRQATSQRERLANLGEEFEDLAEQQSELQREVERAGSSANSAERQSLQEKQADLRRQSERALEQLAGAANNAETEAAKPELRKLNKEVESRRIPQRMAQAEQALEQQQFDRALREQTEAAQNLRRAASGLKESATKLAESPEEKLDLALNETQRLRRNLEDAMQRAQESRTQNAGEQQAPGRGQAQGQQAANAPNHNTPSAPQGGAPSSERLNPDKIDWWNERMWENLRQLENMRPLVENDSALQRDYNEMLDGFRGTLRSFRGGEAQRLTNIENALLNPVRRFEAELATRVAVLQQQERLLNVRDERVPPQYREMVEAYFKKLAQGKQVWVKEKSGN